LSLCVLSLFSSLELRCAGSSDWGVGVLVYMC